MTTPNDALAIAPAQRADIVNLDPDETRRKLAAIAQFQHIVRRELKEGLDYGTIPGTPKPTLLKPGAEKLAKLLNCYDDYEIVERIEDWDKPLFRYLVRCTLADMATGTKISSGLGECNSYESKYRCRWVKEQDIPVHLAKDGLRVRGGKQTIFEFDFALEKRETGGKYGKPADYWDAFTKAIQDGTARRVEKETKSKKTYPGHEMDVDVTQYQVPNPEIYDQVNTILKMAKKRALVDAALSAGRLSDLFTQDLEDTAPEGAIVKPAATTNGDGKPTTAEAPKAQAAEGSAFPDETEPRGISDDQVAAITAKIADIKKLGKIDADIWPQMYKNVQEKFGIQFVQLDELTFQVADYLELRLGEWIEHIKTGQAKKAKGSGKAA